MEYFYLKAKPTKEGHIHRIGIFGINEYPEVIVVTGSVCSVSDNFSSKIARKIFGKNRKKIVIRKDDELFDNVGFCDLISYMMHFGLFIHAEKQNIDWDYCERVWNKIATRIQNENHQEAV